MTNEENNFEKILNQRKEEYEKNLPDRYGKFGLKSNPFPKSGTANINSSDIYIKQLAPIEDRIKIQIYQYIADSLYSEDPKDRFLSATIIGDYGTGKTQLLLYTKYLLNKASEKNYVIYIDNPGVKLSELIGAIIDKIGEENFKKFIWNKIIEKLNDKNTNYKKRLSKYEYSGSSLFHDDNPDPYHPQNQVSFRKFLDTWSKYQNTKKQKQEFSRDLKNIILEIIESDFRDIVISQYFYDLISEDYGINQTWELLVSGSGKYLDKKEVHLLNAIIELVKEQGYDNFYILVDEFEDITRGRLSKLQSDNYLYNLRTLIDKNREWCVLFAMTRTALKQLRTVSPPLADRISNRTINIDRLVDTQAERIVLNYLNIAREEGSDKLYPFTPESIAYINEKAEGIARIFLKNCFFLLERASEYLKQEKEITKEFVESHLPTEV